MVAGSTKSEVPERGARTGRASWFNRFSTPQVLWPIVVMIGLLTGLLLVVSNVLKRLPKGSDSAPPELSLPILLIVATIALLLSVTMILVVFARLNLSNWREALGLPQGSIRAIIALLLIVLFFITAVFLYADIGRPGSTRRLEGVTQERVAQIATEDIVEMTSTGTGENERFTLTLSTRKDPSSIDLAKQLITTVSTLVVAVAAFYFGANSVSSAVSAKKDLAEADRAGGVTVTTPPVTTVTPPPATDPEATAPIDPGPPPPPPDDPKLQAMAPSQLDEFAAVAHATQGTLNVTIIDQPDPTDTFDRQEGAEDDEEEDDS